MAEQNGQNDKTRAFLEKLCTLKKYENGWIAPPEYERLFIQWLEKEMQPEFEYPFNFVEAIIKLELLGYLTVNRARTGEIFNIRIEKDKWDPNRVISPEPAYRPPIDQKRFAILIDYANLELGIKDPVERLRDFSWLLDPILKDGKIVFAFVFLPEQMSSRQPIMQLFHRHGFSPILCPRQIDGAITKDKDTVDARMIDIGMALIEHSDITNLVVVSGDADFQRLVTFAVWGQKKVTVISAGQSLSRALEEMEGKNLSIRRISD